MEVFSMVVALLSGVAMFLYGMMLMGDALKLVAGNKLEAFLYKMTNTPLKGVALGAVFNDLLNSFSRIAAHCAGVGTTFIFMIPGFTRETAGSIRNTTQNIVKNMILR